MQTVGSLDLCLSLLVWELGGKAVTVTSDVHN